LIADIAARRRFRTILVKATPAPRSRSFAKVPSKQLRQMRLIR
jgi:hypothetical protein